MSALRQPTLVTHKWRRKPRSAYRRWERSRAMELWQMDIMGGVRLADGSEAKVVTGINDHTRFCVSAKVLTRATARPGAPWPRPCVARGWRSAAGSESSGWVATD